MKSRSNNLPISIIITLTLFWQITYLPQMLKESFSSEYFEDQIISSFYQNCYFIDNIFLLTYNLENI